MIGERYTLIFKHEVITTEGERYSLEPPIITTCTIMEVLDKGGVIFTLNRMIDELRYQLFKKMDGGE